MKTIKFYLFAAIAILLVACKGGDTMTPVSEKIQGPLGEYFEVVSRDYKAIDGKVSIEIKRIKEGLPAPWEEGMEVGYTGGYCEPLFYIEFQDGDGNVVRKSATYIVGNDDELKAVVALGVGDIATITFRYNKEEGASQFKVTSTFEVHPKEDSTSEESNGSSESGVTSTASDDDSSTASSGSEDWDALLSSYEQYVDQYIKLMKKASNGDASAMTEYASFLEKAQEVSNKMSGAKGSMSASQWAKYMKITNKMASAAQGL